MKNAAARRHRERIKLARGAQKRFSIFFNALKEGKLLALSYLFAVAAAAGRKITWVLDRKIHTETFHGFFW